MTTDHHELCCWPTIMNSMAVQSAWTLWPLWTRWPSGHLIQWLFGRHGFDECSAMTDNGGHPTVMNSAAGGPSRT